MPSLDESSESAPARRADFATTRWSMVLAAGRDNSAQSAAALETLCEAYWYPLYAYVRRQGHAPAEAEDLTQEFFARVIEKRHLQAAEPDRGRFRSFLLTVMKRFLLNEHKKQQTLKRGGGRRPLSIDIDDAESRLRLEPHHEQTPELEFERRWAVTTLNMVLRQLQESYEEKSKRDLFQQCRVYLTDAGDAPSYEQVSQSLGVSVGSVKVAVHRLRQRFREMLRREIAQTVRDESEVDAELGQLIRALRSAG